MITKRKIEIFKKYSGDGDHLVRVGTQEEKSNISDSDWAMIDSFIQDLRIVDNGLAADSFIQRLNDRLRENVENDEIITLIRTLK